MMGEEVKKAFDWLRGSVVMLICTILLLWVALSFLVCIANRECRAHFLGDFIIELPNLRKGHSRLGGRVEEGI